MDTMTARITRPVTFVLEDGKPVTGARKFAAGTVVYARERRDGLFAARVPGTLWCMDVRAADLDPC